MLGAVEAAGERYGGADEGDGAPAKTAPRFTPNAYAYLSDWNSMKDARFLSEILQKGIRIENLGIGHIRFPP